MNENIAQKLYISAATIGTITLISPLFFPNHPTFIFASLLCVEMLSAIGVTLRYYEKVRVLWNTSPRKFMFGAAHVILYFVSMIPAKYLVAKSLGMPAKDYEATIHVLAAVIYVYNVFLLIAIVLFSWGLVSILRAVIHGTISSGAGQATNLVGFPELVARAEIVKRKSDRKIFAAMFDTLGLFVIGSIFLLIACVMEAKLQNGECWVRDIAYYCDYRPAFNYPGLFSNSEIDSNSRVVFHDRGIVSVATRKGLDTRIMVIRLSSGNEE